MTGNRRDSIIADEMRKGAAYAEACAWADTLERRAAEAEAERQARRAAFDAMTDEEHEAKCDEAAAAIVARWPGARALAVFAGAYACIRDEHASANVEWRPYEGDWTANVSEGTDEGETWHSRGHATALEAVDAARALVADAVRQKRAEADALDALLTERPALDAAGASAPVAPVAEPAPAENESAEPTEVPWRLRPPTGAEIEAHTGRWMLMRTDGRIAVLRSIGGAASSLDIHPQHGVLLDTEDLWRPVDREGVPVPWPITEGDDRD